MKPITVSDLVAYLQTQPQDLPVAYCLYSEYALMDIDEIHVLELCAPRPDGWIHNSRPDKPTQKYIVFPGN